MMLGAALRLMRVSHLDAQRILYAVRCRGQQSTTSESPAPSSRGMASFAPVLDILASVHVKSPRADVQ